MSETDSTAAMIVFVLLTTVSAVFFVLTVVRRVRYEMELRRRFAVTPRRRRVSLAAKTSFPGLLSLLVLVVATHSSPVQAQDQQLAATDLDATYTQMITTDTPDTGETDTDATAPFLFLGDHDLNSDPADIAGVEQAKLQACYLTAQASGQSNGYRSDSFDAPKFASLNDSMDAYYAKQRQRLQFDDCAKQ